ncbi:MAG TPA: cytochrome c, partial [Gammaproteobacteria bacterium]|nr:cytochrome c [Gammaproteobacteria bacterium]
MKQLLAASALLGVASLSAAQSARTDRAAVASGEAAYMRVGCFTCHGTVGHGGAAPRLAPNTLPLPGFTTWVRNGTPGWTVASGMPAFPVSVIGDADLADVRAYLASQP